MEPLRDDRLIADLRALRPAPRPQFTAELDERAAVGFPRRSRLPQASFGRFPSFRPRRLLLSTAGAAVAAIAVATVVVIAGQSGSDSGSLAESAPPSKGSTLGDLQYFDGSRPHGEQAPEAGSAGEASGTTYEAEAAAVGNGAGVAAGRTRRDVERSAEITLHARPEDVADDSAKVFEAVHAHGGIVLRSSTQEGAAGEAGATFDLLIPGNKLGDAMAAFSQIDEVRSRHEATFDITAPTAGAADLLKEARSRIESLLSQLEAAETEEEREAVEAELRHERRHAGRLAARLTRLHRRADFSRVALRIETGRGNGFSGGAWGIDDAVDDAGHVLTVAAAVTLIGLAVLGPIALIGLLAWLAHRAWVSRERRRVLS